MYTKRVVINRSVVDKVRLILADGVFEIGQHILDVADPPDLTPFGAGLVNAGGVIAFVDGKKVADSTTIPEGSTGPRQIQKPRAAKLPRPGIAAIVGYGFPGRFVHNGSIHNRANPFLARARDQIVPMAGGLMQEFCRPRLARLRG
jgi:hypothetical protein